MIYVILTTILFASEDDFENFQEDLQILRNILI